MTTSRDTDVSQEQLAATQAAILNALPANVALLDSSGVILAVNEGWRRFAIDNALQSSDFGVGQNYVSICEQATGECAAEAHESAAAIRQVLQGRRAKYVLEYPCHSPVEQRWFRLMVSALPADGAAGAVVMHVDITERKLGEVALRESERRFASAFAHAAIGVALLAPDGRLIAANHALCRLLGFSEAELSGMTIDLVTHPDDAEAALAGMRSILNADTATFQMEKRCIRKDGATVHTALHVSLVRDQHAEPLYFIAQVQDQTQQHRALEAVRMQAAMLDQIGQAVIATDVNGIITYANRQAAELYGWPREAMLNRSVVDVTVPQLTREQGKDILSRLQEGQSWEGEFMVQDRAGRVFSAHVIDSPIIDDAGKLTGIIGISSDISLRKQAEAALLVSEAGLAAAQAQAHLGSWALDLTSMTNDFSAEMCRLIYRDPALGGPSFLEFREAVHPDDRELVDQGLARTAHDSEPFTLEFRTNPSLGPVRYLSATVRTDCDQDGRPIRAVGTAMDVTARKAEEQRRHASESRLRRLFESNVQGILIFNTAGDVLDANDAVLQLTGYTRAEMGSGAVKWTQLTPPEFAALDHSALAELAAAGVSKPYEKEYFRKDGTRVPVLIGAAMFEDKPEEGVAFVVDLTERKRLEQQFLRTQRLQSLGTMAGGIAHDLNNVLTPIVMAVEMLGELNPDPENRAVLQTLKASADRGADLVKQVLSFARGMKGDRVPVSLAPLLHDLLKILRETFPKSVAIHFDTVPAPWTVLGDPTQLNQVLLNLCVNARDAMPNGGMLTVSLENVVLDETYAALNPEAAKGAYVMIKVADTGTGIPPGVRERVFEPFYTTKEMGQGTGLGLSTTLAIVRSHGGFINLYSEVGRGSKFKVYFPASATAEIAEEVALKQSALPRGEGELVLVVDDDDGVREIARRTLERYGYRVLMAAHGAEAVAIYAQRGAEIAVVLTDMSMPIMDGPALIVALRAMDPGVRIIGSSGLASNGGVARAIGAGVSQFVPKPYTARGLLTHLRAAITGEDPA